MAGEVDYASVSWTPAGQHLHFIIHINNLNKLNSRKQQFQPGQGSVALLSSYSLLSDQRTLESDVVTAYSDSDWPLYRGDRYISEWFGQWLHDRSQPLYWNVLNKGNKMRQFQQTTDREKNKQTNRFSTPYNYLPSSNASFVLLKNTLFWWCRHWE